MLKKISIKILLLLNLSFLISHDHKNIEQVKTSRYIKQVVILSNNMDALLGEMIQLFGPYEARMLESSIKEYLPKNWHDPKAKVEIYYIKTQKSKIINYIVFTGSGKKIDVIFKDFEKSIIVEDAPDLIKIEIDPKYALSVYKLPSNLLQNLQIFLKKVPKNYAQYKNLLIYYRAADFKIQAVIYINQKNGKEYCIDFDEMIVNRNGYELKSTVFSRYYGLNTKIYITSPYGTRYHPVLKKKTFHSGIDLRAETGTKVHAAHEGRVLFRGWLGGYGNCVKISHGNNIISLYGHLSRFAANLKVGTWVKKGTLIAYSGSTGRSTGPHLHFEIQKNKQPVDPQKFLFSYYKTIKEELYEEFNELIKQIEELPES